jgi:hypothetical protein
VGTGGVNFSVNAVIVKTVLTTAVIAVATEPNNDDINTFLQELTLTKAGTVFHHV